MGKIQKQTMKLISVPALLTSLGIAVLSGCAGSPNLQESTSLNANGDDGTGNAGDAGDADAADRNRNFSNPDLDPPLAACRAGTIDQVFDIKPASIRGANIVFLVDDSGSMSGEIQKVISQVGNFLGGINSATADNYKVALIYDHLYYGSAFKDKQFYDSNNQPIDKVLYPNPLQPYINASMGKIKHIKSATWSKWADIAFFKAFAQKDYDQAVTDIAGLPEDSTDFTGTTTRPAEITYANCSNSLSFWYRPRFMNFNSKNDGGTLGCIGSDSAKASNTIALDTVDARNQKIEDYLIRNVAVNFIALSDDDLNVNFTGRVPQLQNISNITWNVANYPEVSLKMMKQVLKPIGSDVPVYYHSIIGLNRANGGIDEVGHAHWALSKKTGGAIHDITAASYADAFSKISKKVIFSEQVVNLDCAIPNGTNPVVKLNGLALAASKYTVTNAGKDIRLLPAAFGDGDETRTLRIEVLY